MENRAGTAAAPIVEDDATIAKALEQANVPALMMALIHMSGDETLLRGTIRPTAMTMGDPQGGLSEEQQAEIRRRARGALVAYRDRGCTLPAFPPRDTLFEMMSFMVGTPVPEEYVPMVIEEMALGA